MKQADRIADLERRVREFEQAPRTYPMFVPVYVQPPAPQPSQWTQYQAWPVPFSPDVTCTHPPGSPLVSGAVSFDGTVPFSQTFNA